jgi:SOS response regulatory protein OraA/RecX
VPVREPSSRALDAGIRALSRRELSVVELRDRLQRAGIPADEADGVVVRLRETGYQSDQRAAQERARVLAARNLGDAAISLDLERRGLSTESTDAALSELPPELERAERLVRRVSHEKLWNTLQRKGFSTETIEALASAGIADAP